MFRSIIVFLPSLVLLIFGVIILLIGSIMYKDENQVGIIFSPFMTEKEVFNLVSSYNVPILDVNGFYAAIDISENKDIIHKVRNDSIFITKIYKNYTCIDEENNNA